MFYRPDQGVLKNLYGAQNLASNPVFSGGYINFGYWKNVPITDAEISEDNRTMASIALYDLIFKTLSISNDDHVLEVGCGQGYGCVHLQQTYQPKTLVGIDLTPEQIDRANERHHAFLCETPSLSFRRGAIESITEESKYTKLYAIESAQHFADLEAIAQKMWSLLCVGGEVAITAHFAKDQKGFDAALEHLPLIQQGIDSFYPIQYVVRSFERAGFLTKNLFSIGEHVFPPFHRWLEQKDTSSWGHKLFFLFQTKKIDYFVCHFVK